MIKDPEGLADLQWGGWGVGGHQRPEDPVVDLGVEDGEPLPVSGEEVGIRVLQPDDQALQSEPP